MVKTRFYIFFHRFLDLSDQVDQVLFVLSAKPGAYATMSQLGLLNKIGKLKEDQGRSGPPPTQLKQEKE